MKIALVYPRYRYPSGDPPLGLAALAGVLRNAGIEAELLDPTFEKNPRSWLLDRLAEGSWDMVGFSAMVTQIKDALEAAQLTKLFHPFTKIIIGGPQATVMPEEVLKHPAVDAVCVGEGEAAILEMARRGGFEELPGVWHKKNGEIVRSPSCEPLDLDALPAPDFSGLPIEKYLSHWFQLDSVSIDLRGLPVIASRGCPYHCSYCQPTLERLFGRGLRKRSPDGIVEELKGHVSRYGINAFNFLDDTFPADKKWAIDVCKALESANLGLKWGANIRADLADRELLVAMKRAGLAKIFVGIESSSERVLKDIYRKGISISQAHDTITLAKELDIKIQGYFMMGAPTETPEEILETIRLARRLPLNEAVFNITTPLPGTELFDRFRDQIAMPVEDMDYYSVYPWKGGAGVSAGRLARWRMWAYLSFYLHPKRIGILAGQLGSGRGLKRTLLKLRRLV